MVSGEAATESEWDAAGLFSRWTFGVASPLLALGQQKVLQWEDLYRVSDHDRAERVVRDLDRTFREAPRRTEGAGGCCSWLTRLVYALYKANVMEFWVISFWTLMETVTRVAQPVVLGLLLEWLDDSTTSGDGKDAPLWEGCMYASIISLLAVAQMVVHHILFYFTMRMGWNLRTATSGLLQDRLLQLSTTTLAKTTTGQVVNLLANDARRYDEACVMGSFIWAGPIDVIAVTILIARILGVLPAVVGVMSVLVVIPVQVYLAKSFSKYRRDTAEASDDRIRHTAEVIEGIGSVKAFAWETPFIELILSKRNAETAAIGKAQSLKSFSLMIALAAPALSSFATFAVFWASGRTFTVAKVFSTIALLQVVRASIGVLWTRAVETLAEASVSSNRIQEFLEMAEDQVGYTNTNDDSNGTADGVVVDDGDVEMRDRGNHTNANSIEPPLDPVPVLTEHDKPEEGAMVYVPSGSQFYWESPARPVLRNVGLSCNPGELLMVVGPVGSGKTSLLMSLLGEVPQVGRERGNNSNNDVGTQDQFIRPGCRVAYCGQAPWIRSCSVRENIVYAGKTKEGQVEHQVDEQLYSDVLDACALRSDMGQWPNGDRTEIGERGVNLSGGQRARVALARAVYSDADVYLLDDPLSAVDSAVSRVLFNKCLCKMLRDRGKCVILVTHQLQYVAKASRVFVLDRSGQCVANDTARSLVARQVDLTGLVEAFQAGRQRSTSTGSGLTSLTSNTNTQRGVGAGGGGGLPSLNGVEEDAQAEEQLDPKTAFEEAVAAMENDGADEGDDALDADADPNKSKVMDKQHMEQKDDDDKEKDMQGKDLVKIVEAEERVQGQVTLATYGKYLRSGGTGLGTLVFVLMLLGQMSVLAADYWLGVIANASDQRNSIYIIVFASIVGATFLFGMTRAVAFFHFCLTAASSLHSSALDAVVHSPLAFFVANPSGRILNKFSKDQGSIDELLPIVFFNFVQYSLFCLGTVAVVCASVYWLLFLFVPLVYVFRLIRNKFMASSREIKRMEGIYKSPVYNEFSATIHGLVSIRAYGLQDKIKATFVERLDNYGRAWYCFLLSNRWLGFRLDCMTVVVLIATCFSAIALRHDIHPSLVGMALVYTLALSGLFQWTVRQSAEVENNLTSVERISHYAALPAEPGYAMDGRPSPATATVATTTPTSAESTDADDKPLAPPTPARVPDNWPSVGTVELRDLSVRYRADLEPVIHHLNAVLPGGSKVGVVGRTGSGKSSLLQALLRLNQVCGGDIVLDNVPLSTIGLKRGRREVALIPQEPHLFTGTVRFNLDPFGAYRDEEIWAALEDAQLKTAIAEDPKGLEAEVTEHGSNWSVGQRQLLSLARAILRQSKVILMDEATANVDYHTDSLIQQTIRSSPALVNGTIITVAHRLRTVMDSDFIMVLADGELVEFDTPWNLVQNHESAFYRMVKHTGEKEALLKIAQDKHEAPGALLSSLAITTSPTEDEKTATL